MFTLQGLSVVITLFGLYMWFKTKDNRWSIPVIILAVMAIWSPWVKTVPQVQHHSSFNTPVKAVPERVTVERETLEEKQQKLIEKSKGDN